MAKKATAKDLHIYVLLSQPFLTHCIKPWPVSLMKIEFKIMKSNIYGVMGTFYGSIIEMIGADKYVQEIQIVFNPL
jgi:hypothetical protein